MGKYLFICRYSSASWARLVKSSDDRTAAVRSLMESLGGALDLLYWAAHGNAMYEIAELPDETAAKAAVTTMFETGAFTNIEVQELLTQNQLSDALMLTRSAAKFYEVPGQAAVERLARDTICGRTVSSRESTKGLRVRVPHAGRAGSRAPCAG